MTFEEWFADYGFKRPALGESDMRAAWQAARATAERSNSVYPDELTPELREVLGWPNFKCGPFAHLMVAAGAEIKPKAEDEQAAVLHWLIKLVLKHGEKWNEAASADLIAMRDTVQAIESQRTGNRESL